MSTFQQLYDSEINFSISCLWDGGFQIKLGDELNGYVSQTCVDTWAEVDPWLRAEALLHFPESRFARESLIAI